MRSPGLARLIAIRRYPQGPRVWIAGQRVHHGATGAMLAIVARRHRRLLAAAILLCLHDRHDFRVWFAREILPASSLTPTTIHEKL